MDRITHYRSDVERLVLELRVNSSASIHDQIARLIRQYVTTAAHCRLVLVESDSVVAQAFRNYRSPKIDPNEWAGRVVLSDIESLLRLRIESTADSVLRNVVYRWQSEQLRREFDKETPWYVIADWHAENGDQHKAEVCRRMSDHDGKRPKPR